MAVSMVGNRNYSILPWFYFLAFTLILLEDYITVLLVIGLPVI
jgi:hypothetical protein